MSERVERPWALMRHHAGWADVFSTYGPMSTPSLHYSEYFIELIKAFFASVAKYWTDPGVGVILTGMGADGAKGMLEMKGADAFTIAQDEASCVVFGMPREAILLGGVDQVLPLDRIPNALLHRLGGGKGSAVSA